MSQIDKRNGKWIDFRVDEKAILDNAIKSRHIAPDTIVAADIAPGAVGSEEIAENIDVSYKGFIGGMVFKLSIDSGTINIPSGYHAQVVVGPINNKYTIDGVLQVDGDFILFEL